MSCSNSLFNFIRIRTKFDKKTKCIQTIFSQQKKEQIFSLCSLFSQLNRFPVIEFSFSLKGGDPAAPSDTATLLWLHPSRWFYLRQLPPFAGLAHRLRVPPTPMAWQAVCTRPGNAFTPTFWFGITSNFGFVWASFSPQSELRVTFWGLLHLPVSLLFVLPIVARL